jgi:hypothetical protein
MSTETGQLQALRVMCRDDVPPLTDTKAWAEFPVADYDVVAIDSLDATAEGVGEQDSAKPARAIAPILDLCDWRSSRASFGSGRNPIPSSTS